MPARKRKVRYPPARTANRPAPAVGAGFEPGPPRPTVAAIDLNALKGRDGFKVGDRVRILGSGLYAGELAVIERLSNVVLPSATVRTEAGRVRQVRTIDLEQAPSGD